MKRIILLYFLSFSIFAFAQSDTEKYVRVKVFLHDTPISTLAELGLEYDHGEIAKGRYWINDISPQDLNIIKENNLTYEILIDDVQAWYVAQNKLPVEAHSRSEPNQPCLGPDLASQYETPVNYTYGSMGGYLTYQEMLDVLDSMQLKFPNLISKKQEIGEYRTQEDRPIHWLKVGSNPNIDEDKPAILYNSLTHAREPNSMAQLIFYIWYLLENYETDPEVKYIMDHVELYFIPCVNPDGYVYNEMIFPEGGGFWRKNRSLNEDGEAVGVDLNRNYGYDWGLEGASDNQNSEQYRGIEPFSEPETQAVVDFCNEHSFKIALNCHSFSNLLIFPTAEVNTDDATFDALGKKMTEQNNYGLGTDIETVGYFATGDCSDWMYNEQESKPKILAMAPEVGPLIYGFWPPVSAIDQLNKENLWQNISAAALLKPYGEIIDNSPDILSTDEGVFFLEVVNIGLEEGALSVQIQSTNENLLIESQAQTYNLSHLDTGALSFNYTILDTELTAQEFTFEVLINNGGVERIIPITKEYYAQPFETVFLDAVEAEVPNWILSSQWAATDKTFYSEEFSITDSPNANYRNNNNSFIQITELIDLRGALAATVQFQAKWELEPRFDFVNFSISINNINYTPICGEYTVLDDRDEPAYNGFQRDWVLEKIDLSPYLGQEVSFRFQIKTDEFATEDGFYFDDFSVQVIREEALTSTTTADIFEDNFIDINPNPFEDQLILNFNLKENIANLKIRLVNTVGQEVGVQSLDHLTEGAHTFHWEHLDIPAGVYFLEIETDDFRSGIKKVLKH